MLIHVVTLGETLWQIASRYGVDFTRLVAVNKLPDAGRLVIGQALIIPSAARQHTVKSGETLWKIAQQYGASVDSLMQANQLTDSSVINPGKVLYIPARTHTVQPGESLGQIA